MAAVILAAGQGTRMKSAKPKVMHALCGRPMLHYVVEAAQKTGAVDVIAVVGHGRDEVTEYLRKTFGERVHTALQEKQRGTGDAARCGLSALPEGTRFVLILCGDTPLLESADLAGLEHALNAAGPSTPLALLTADVPDPTGYGRILRDENGRVTAIREQRDCSPEQAAIREINAGVYLAKADFLRDALAALSPNNAQGELYLTDIVAAAREHGGAAAVKSKNVAALAGINDRAQLAAIEEILYDRIANNHRRAGVTIRGTARIDASVLIEPDATVEHGAVLRGATHIKAGALIDVGSVLTDTVVEPGANVKPYSVCTGAIIGDKAQIGPFSHLRPESRIEADAHIGNFVETKKTIVRKGAKANHLAYLGDGDIGERANIGAGTIFCNYDGFKKHKTEIGAGAFIGSDSQLVAPVRVGEGAYVATGTTITKDVPPEALAIARVPQVNKENYAPRLREKLQGK